MSIINFYNDSCKIVCSWKKGGIAGLNKVFPDSVQKEKIIPAKTTTADSNKIKNSQNISLPGSIEKPALLKKKAGLKRLFPMANLSTGFQINQIKIWLLQ